MLYCKNCGSSKVRPNGTKKKKQQYKCAECGSYKQPIKDNKTKTDFRFKEENNKAEVSTKTKVRIKTLGDLIKVCEIDTSVWDIERWICNKWEVGVNNDGVIETEPLYQVKAWLKKNKPLIELNHIKDEIKDELKSFAPKYTSIVYQKEKEGFLLEVDMPDLHFGKLCWNEESGDDYDIKIAEEYALKSINTLINRCSSYKIDRILFPLGNDFFNVNDKTNTTSHNTPQQEDTRWQKTFKAGRELSIKIIDMLSVLAPVDVLIITGNHDEERTFYLGDALECWYHNNKNVMIDNKAIKRKYYSYGDNLIGLTHGYWEKLNDLPMIMALEEPKLWSKSKFREWQTGDKHHKKEIKTTLRENEMKGVMVRILRSLSGNDAWHFDKGFVGGQKGIEGFIRHKNIGLIAQINSII